MDKDKVVALYQSIAKSNKPRVYEHWHASSTYECPRAQYLKRKGLEGAEKPSGAKIIRWGAGHKLEEELRQHVDSVWGGTTSNERLTSDKLDLTGEYDNLTKSPPFTLIEVKSVSDWAFHNKSEPKRLKQSTGVKNKWGRDEFEPRNTPYLHHEYQNHAYALLLAEAHIDVTGIDYLYSSLSGLMCVYHTEVDPEKLDWVKRRVAGLNKYWQSQELPPCYCLRTDDPLYDLSYRWCEFKTEGGCCEAVS